MVDACGSAAQERLRNIRDGLNYLKRYEPDVGGYPATCGCCPGGLYAKMVEEELGGWVRWIDVKELINGQ